MALTRTRAAALEEPLVIEGRAEALYGVLHHAAGTPKGAVLLVAADGEERFWSQRLVVRTARLLAKAGYVSLRFDLAGQGESDGDYEDQTLRSRVEDVGSALRVLQQQAAGLTTGAIGVRLGSALSVLAAVDFHVGWLSLWEPVLDLRDYLQGQLRINIATQMVMHKRVLRNREGLVEDLRAGGRVSINGFMLAKAFYEEMEAADPIRTLGEFRGPVLLLASSATRVPEAFASATVRPGYPAFWKEPKTYFSSPDPLLGETLKWLDRQVLSGVA